MNLAPSPPELRVLELAAAGLQTREIAAALGKSEWTVQRQLRRAREKLGQRTMAGAVGVAFRSGLLR